MPARDRVRERRKAAALARHYRDEEGLSIAAIARRLGWAEATVKAYLYDPLGEKDTRGQGALPGRLPGLRRVDQRAQWQGGRVCLLQALPSWDDRAAMDPRAGCARPC